MKPECKKGEAFLVTRRSAHKISESLGVIHVSILRKSCMLCVCFRPRRPTNPEALNP